MAVNLKPQDIVFLLKLVAREDNPWSFNKLAVELNMSPSHVHGSTKRVLAARLANHGENGIQVNMQNLREFLVHGVKYAFVPELGSLVRGMPTAHAAPPLSQVIMDEELPPVWPDKDGETRGLAFSPLYKSVPAAARQDQELYELLALVDSIRGGRARERNLAIKTLDKRLEKYGKKSKSKS